MKTSGLTILIGTLTAVLGLAGSDQPSLNAHLELLRPLLGKTWKGTFKDSKPDKPMEDVARWERTLNGQGVRMLHSVGQGIYGGETVFVWDEKKQLVTFYYFTTAGYMTTGTIEAKEGRILTHEEVKGDANGITEVRATSEFLPGGKFHVKSEYLKDGQWKSGHEITYQEAPSAEVVFK